MTKFNTKLLLQELRESNDIEAYVSRFEKDLDQFQFHDYLNYLLEVTNIKKSDVITGSKLHRTYGYQVFSGLKVPSRDKVIMLAFGFCLSVDQTNRLLNYGEYSPLHPRNKRDATILFGLMNNRTLDDTNDLLYELDKELLQ